MAWLLLVIFVWDCLATLIQWNKTEYHFNKWNIVTGLLLSVSMFVGTLVLLPFNFASLYILAISVFAVIGWCMMGEHEHRTVSSKPWAMLLGLIGIVCSAVLI